MNKQLKADTSNVKRVELHLHTQMSEMDGVTSPANLVTRACEWGHAAVAITDHGVAQAFPEAFYTAASLKAKGKNIKIIPGVEAYLVESSLQVVKNPVGSITDKIALIFFIVPLIPLEKEAGVGDR